eukprot:NODE_8914_length_390_cov_27.436950_g8026_i0.p1 GENE.NODE_8914_length_390_cov_27.436950_g8026_i0~~NODE_8914_length_390_cov_27.436950_g8026_i0.p1  ORF type:complete len:87 (+),score=6.34 NODE_8914_length_390_cov_27.436950_g8026_i0:46-306(+)
MTIAYRTFLGQRVWKTPILKLYWPFMLTGPTIFFLFSAAHTAMSGDTEDKWNRIVDIARENTARTKMQAEATAWYEAQLASAEKSA